MKKPEEITYLFGAGASYYSMPLVENFGNRFNLFINFIRHTVNASNQAFLNDCIKFKEEVTSHLSFDTFFKKLFHLGETATEKYKAILLVFFLYEQLRDVSDNDIFNEPEKYGKKYGIKKGNLDPRYDALIAGILNPIKSKFSPITKVNFLTWNYDTNLIASIKNFKSSSTSLTQFVKTYETCLNYFNIDSELQVIHLNGRVFHPRYSKYEPCNDHNLKVELTSLINEYNNIDSGIWENSNEIKFSWETLAETDLRFGMPVHLANAIDAVKRSSVLIIIGYSFPLYNRLIDAAIINQENLNGKSIYLQDPKSNELKDVLINDFGLIAANSIHFIQGTQSTVVVKAIENCNSFFVPSNIYISPLNSKTEIN